jgi:phosphoribosyl-AMP cyclohydrolase
MSPMSSGVKIQATTQELSEVKYDAAGLVVAIAQDVDTKAVLMVAYMNAETLKATLESGRMVYWSRSRQEVWRKGDTSGDRQFVREAYYDCDADALLFLVEQEGKGACHTGAYSCFFRRFGQ